MNARMIMFFLLIIQAACAPVSCRQENKSVAAEFGQVCKPRHPDKSARCSTNEVANTGLNPSMRAYRRGSCGFPVPIHSWRHQIAANC